MCASVRCGCICVLLVTGVRIGDCRPPSAGVRRHFHVSAREQRLTYGDGIAMCVSNRMHLCVIRTRA